MTMPTRFPTGLNMLKPETPLSIAPLPLMCDGWGWFFDDFNNGSIIQGAATAPLNVANYAYVSLTASAVAVGFGGGSTINKSVGNLTISTAANANGAVTVYVPANSSVDANNPSVTLPTMADDWVIAFRLAALSNTGAGFAVGCATAADINDGIGTTLDFCQSATNLANNGFLFRKGSGSVDVIADMYSGGSKIMTSQTMLAAASVTTTTPVRYTAVYSARANKIRLYTNNALTATVTPSAAMPSSGTGVFLAGRSDGTNATSRNIVFDYVYVGFRTTR
jgi:hypothetical protein